MKNFTLLAFVILFLASCAKEDITPLVTESPDGITRLYVKVSFLDCYAGQNCTNTEYVPVNNAEVYLYDNENGVVEGKNALMDGQTDGAGLVKFEHLENGEYLVKVHCEHGDMEKEVTVEPKKITRIELRY